MGLKRLQHLLLLAEELHFSRAAQRAHLSQTAFNRSIQSLEQELGLRLFDRGTRSVVLTASGAQLVQRAREVVRQTQYLRQAAEGLLSGQAGRLAFGVSQMVESGWLAELVEHLQQAGPRVELDVEVHHWEALRDLLLSERLEFFIAYAAPLQEDARFHLTELRPLPVSVYCRAGHPLLQESALAAQRLLAFPWACVRFNAAIERHLCQLLGLQEQRLPMSLTSNSLELLRQRALHSDTLLLTWRHWLEDDLQRGQLVDLQSAPGWQLPAQALQLPCSLVRLAGRSLSPLAERAIEQALARG